MIYFAYGSNMLAARLQRRVPSAKIIATAFLAGYSLRFSKQSIDGSGKATVAKDSGDDSMVHGVLFEVDPEEKRTLDRYEGLGSGYAEQEVEVETDSGTKQATTYIGTNLDDRLKPYQWYKDLVLAGAHEAHLPNSYIAEIESVEAIDDPDPSRAARNREVISWAS